MRDREIEVLQIVDSSAADADLLDIARDRRRTRRDRSFEAPRSAFASATLSVGFFGMRVNEKLYAVKSSRANEPGSHRGSDGPQIRRSHRIYHSMKTTDRV